MKLIAAFLAFACPLCTGQAAEITPRFLTFEEVRDTLLQYAGSGLPGTEIHEGAEWAEWIRTRDAEVRTRVDRGTEDSISNFILYGTSFTSLPRVKAIEYAAAATGDLRADTKARVHALAAALASEKNNERVLFVREFLARQGIARNSFESFFSRNLRRLIAEQSSYQQKLKDAERVADPGASMMARGTLFESRGLSTDASLLPNLAIEEALRAMMRKGALKMGGIKRIAIVGPGLDFADKRAGYDFYPLQTMQPFAIWEAVARLFPDQTVQVQVDCLDLNSAVIEHIRKLTGQGRAGKPYTLQLPHESNADWSEQALAYWNHFGEILGTPVNPLPVNPAVGDRATNVETRAVAIRPAYLAHIQTYNSNIVAQTLDLPGGEGFDLIVATNILVYYDRFQQALAMLSTARMLNPGGIFLANTVLPAQHTSLLEYLGRRSISYSRTGSYGDDVVVYRRR